MPVAKMDSPSRHAKIFESWFEDNPLRRYRKRWGVPRKVIAHNLNVHDSTVRNWENGFGQPQDEHFAALKGQSIETWTREWAAWLEAKPNAQ